MTDTRFQALMPDPLVWLGVTKIHKLVSMSNVKYDAITAAGIEVAEHIVADAVSFGRRRVQKTSEEKLVREKGGLNSPG